METWNRVYMIHDVYITACICTTYVHKFMHMHMYHEYESVYEYGSNAFELLIPVIARFFSTVNGHWPQTYPRLAFKYSPKYNYNGSSPWNFSPHFLRVYIFLQT